MTAQTDEPAHAKRSPSGAHRWLHCTASVDFEERFPRAEAGIHADTGTAAHTISAIALTRNCDAERALAKAQLAGELPDHVACDDDMLTDVQAYIDSVRAHAVGNLMFVEQAVPIDSMTLEEGATGTADAIIIADDGNELQVHDLKFGYGEVDAVENEQLMMYAVGALLKYDMQLSAEPRIRLFIHQVRHSHVPKEWETSHHDLMLWADKVPLILKEEPTFTPGEEQCRWCSGRQHCKARLDFIENDVLDGFDSISEKHQGIDVISTDDLARIMSYADTIEQFLTDIRARVEQEIATGTDVPGWKLVAGRRGARKWTNEDEVLSVLTKSMRIPQKDVCDFKLKGPASLEKLLVTEKKRWERLTQYITQTDGRPSVVPVTDKRPALDLRPSADEFNDINESLTE
jgi:hypothetical protein